MITEMLRRKSDAEMVSNVIIETEPNEYHNILREVGAVYPIYQGILGFNMFSLSAPLAFLKVVDNLTGVKTIYPDKQNSILPVGDRLRGLLRARAAPTKYILPTSETRKLLEVPTANAEGISGRDVVIAVLDSGTFSFPHVGFGVISGVLTQPQLVERRVEIYNANQNIDADLKGGMNDKCGHGTQVITIVGGYKYTYLNNLECQGVSMDSKLIGIKCLYGRMGSGRDSDIIRALEIAMTQGAHIINMSLGSETDFDTYTWKEDAICKTIEELHNKGILVCCANGNSGEKGFKTVNAPATSPHAIAVGSFSHNYQDVAFFSSKGPSPDGFTRPTCVSYGGGAPNSSDEQEVIFSGTMPTSLMDVPDGVDGAAGLMGTSQATPHFAGLLSLWYQYFVENHDRPITYDDVIKILKTNGNPTPNDTEGYGLPKYSWVKNF